jgi:dipeptidyl aminopeptidase/acylaminoacyl peptidase
LVLFNPVLIVAPVDPKISGFENKMANMEERMGASPESMSPFHNIVKGTAPTIIFHGTDDTTVPFKTAQLYNEKMNRVGNSCKLIAYEGESHGFFNFGKKSNGAFIDTVNKMDKFLVSLGYLESPPKAFEVK